jgi:hypothetical protein
MARAMPAKLGLGSILRDGRRTAPCGTGGSALRIVYQATQHPENHLA